MTLRLHSLVQHGYIDNRINELVTVKLWLFGRKHPIDVILKGNCHRDIAGSILTFRNKETLKSPPAWIKKIPAELHGTVGDITASSRVELVCSKTHKTAWHNRLSIEIFQNEYGRILIESLNFDMELTEHIWKMDADEEQSLFMCTQNTFRDYVQQQLQQAETRTPRATPIPFLAPPPHKKCVEIIADIYREVCEKYGYDIDGEVHRAYVMGWDHVLAAMAYTEETGEPFFFSETDTDNFFADLDELSEEAEAKICRGNPLYERIQRFAIQAHEWIKNFPVEIHDTETTPYKLLRGIYTIIEKLSLVLVRLSHGEPERDRLLTPLSSCITEAQQVCRLLQHMPFSEKEFLAKEIYEEWMGIAKDIAKLKFRIAH